MQQASQSSILMLFLTVCLAGCGGAEVDKRGHRVGVSGEVTLDGQPLSNARIVFITDKGAGAVKASGLIEDGIYSIDAGQGPLAGSARVEITPELMELEVFEAAKDGDRHQKVETRSVVIPGKYNRQSQLTAQLSSDRENVFRYDLFSR